MEDFKKSIRDIKKEHPSLFEVKICLEDYQNSVKSFVPSITSE